MSTLLSNFCSNFASSARLRGLVLAGTALLAARTLATAALAKGYKRKLPARRRRKAANGTAPSAEEDLLKDLKLDTAEFVQLLESFVAHSEKLQNNPPALVPQEDLVADLVLAFLQPYADVLEVRRVRYVDGRSNVIVKYNGSAKRVVSFVGSHMDVVTANPAEFKRDPFKLTVEGDMLYGRGVTDCLGHVAMLCCIFKQLAIIKPKLQGGVAAVFIANEVRETEGNNSQSVLPRSEQANSSSRDWL